MVAYPSETEMSSSLSFSHTQQRKMDLERRFLELLEDEQRIKRVKSLDTDTNALHQYILNFNQFPELDDLETVLVSGLDIADLLIFLRRFWGYLTEGKYMGVPDSPLFWEALVDYNVTFVHGIVPSASIYIPTDDNQLTLYTKALTCDISILQTMQMMRRMLGTRLYSMTLKITLPDIPVNRKVVFSTVGNLNMRMKSRVVTYIDLKARGSTWHRAAYHSAYFTPEVCETLVVDQEHPRFILFDVIQCDDPVEMKVLKAKFDRQANLLAFNEDGTVKLEFTHLPAFQYHFCCGKTEEDRWTGYEDMFDIMLDPTEVEERDLWMSEVDHEMYDPEGVLFFSSSQI